MWFVFWASPFSKICNNSFCFFVPNHDITEQMDIFLFILLAGGLYAYINRYNFRLRSVRKNIEEANKFKAYRFVDGELIAYLINHHAFKAYEKFESLPLKVQRQHSHLLTEIKLLLSAAESRKRGQSNNRRSSSSSSSKKRSKGYPRNAYKVLGLTHPSTLAEAKSAYRKLAMKYHPDKGGTKEQFGQVKKAYEVVEQFLEK